MSDFYRSDKPDKALIDRDREVGRDQFDKYDIKDIAKMGRYYLAKILDQNGRITDTVLIDKLSRTYIFKIAKKDRLLFDRVLAVPMPLIGYDGRQAAGNEDRCRLY